jgi:hypothetical protein
MCSELHFNTGKFFDGMRPSIETGCGEKIMSEVYPSKNIVNVPYGEHYEFPTKFLFYVGGICIGYGVKRKDIMLHPAYIWFCPECGFENTFRTAEFTCYCERTRAIIKLLEIDI